MKIRARWILVLGVVSLAVLLAMTAGLPVVHGKDKHEKAQHARWDIISLNTATTPPTLSPGGIAFATADTTLKIRLTGSGTFVDPAGHGGGSHAVTGGGTWETFNGTTSTGSGTYSVEELADFEFANFQAGSFIDLIGNTNERANGNAVLRIEYSDGSEGVLFIGCHGPGAPDGILEGVAATKGFATYLNVQGPSPGVDANRTVFHVRR